MNVFWCVWNNTWSISRKCIRNAICFAATQAQMQVLGHVRRTHKLGFQNWRKVIHWIMSGRPALDINKLMEARPFSTNHSSLSRRWSLRSLYTCYVSFKEIDSLPRIGESVSSSFPRYVLHQQIHCQGMVDHLWLQMHCNATLGVPATAMRMLLHCIPATAVQVHPCYCKCYCTASLLLHCIPATALHCCKCHECCTADAVVLANAGGPLAEVL